MDNIIITQMNLNDFDLIEPIFSSDFDEFWNSNILKEELQSNNSKFIVAKIGDEVVGFAGFKILFDVADIMNIVVKKSFRNKKIGTLLLKTLIELFESFDLLCLNLEVNENNIYAINLYKHFGFEEICIRKNYYSNGENAIIMKLDNYKNRKH